MKKGVKVSVIIPIFNTEKYLREAVDSVISQDIGFEENVQIILINDGSLDKSEEICLEYKEKYPLNIQYIYQENAGVSVARNNAIQHIKGKYVIFLDSDDYLGNNVLSKTYELLESNEKVDVAAVRVKYFEATNKYHKLDYKYDGKDDCVIDLLENYDYVQNSCSNTLIRVSALEGKCFNDKLKYSEDFTLICDILLENNKLGIIPSATYYYRQREDNSSAINTRREDVMWYTITPELCFRYLFEKSKKKYGKVLPYIQWFVMYDLQWRLLANPQLMTNTLSEEEQTTYQNLIFDLLKEIDDEIIIKQRYISIYFKTFCLSKKYNRPVEEIIESLKLNPNGYFEFKGHPILNVKKWSGIKIITIDVKHQKLLLSGYINDFFTNESYELFLISNTRIKEKLVIEENGQIERQAFNGDVVKTGKYFTAAIKINNVSSIKLESHFRGERTFNPLFKYADSAKLDGISKQAIFGHKVIKTLPKEIQVCDYSAIKISLKRIKRKSC